MVHKLLTFSVKTEYFERYFIIDLNNKPHYVLTSYFQTIYGSSP